MESLFLLCFRSCLRSKDEEDRLALYRLLEVDKAAPTDVIKKAYKKKSLQLHPDKLAQRGMEVTPEHKQSFLRLKEAHDILTDPKRRKLYDQLGESGLQLMENPNPVTLIKNFQQHKADQCWIILLLSFFFGCLFILPILFVLKCDGTLGPASPWVSIWTPMWVVDLALLILAVLLFAQKDEPSHSEDEHGNPVVDDTESVPLGLKIVNFVSVCAFVVAQIFVTARLDTFITWDWFAVFAPWFLFEAIIVVMAGITAFSFVPPPDYASLPPAGARRAGADGEAGEDGDDTEEEYKMKRAALGAEYYGELFERAQARNEVLSHLLRIWQAVFLALQANTTVTWNWGLVLLPVWVHIVKQYVFGYLLWDWGQRVSKGLGAEGLVGEAAGGEDDPESDMHRAVGGMISSTYLSTFIGTLPLTFMAILLVCRLQAGTFTTFVIILPVFLFLSCGCCALFCGLCVLVNTDADAMSQRMGDPSAGGGGGGGGGSGGAASDAERGEYEPPAHTQATTPFINPSTPSSGLAGPNGTAAARGRDHDQVEMHDINVNLAQADRAAWAALYAPAATSAPPAAPAAATAGGSGAGASKSVGSNGTAPPPAAAAATSSSGISTVFIPPPPPPPAPAGNSSGSGSVSPPSSLTALLPISHIDADID